MACCCGGRTSAKVLDSGVNKAGGVGNKAQFAKNFFASSNAGEVAKYYDIEKKQLGEGSYGHVAKAVDKSTRQERAIKTIAKTSKQASNLARFQQEISLMRELDHPSIVKLYETFEDARNIYLVLELCKGGELFDRIIADSKFKESDCAYLMKQLCGAIFHLHVRGIMHRDLKPENFLFAERNLPVKESTLKIIDFGLSCPFKKGEFKTTRAGTPYYVSPQVLDGRYNEQADVWSLGVIMYTMCCGYPPFYGDTDDLVLKRVRAGDYKFDRNDWGNISVQAKNLIKACLDKDPKKRLTAEQAYKSTWIQENAPEAQNIKLNTENLQRLHKFHKANSLKKAALHVIAASLPEADIKELKGLFTSLDENGDGMLQMSELQNGLKKIGGLNDTIAQSLTGLIANLDTDGSGAIDYTEFLAATLDRKKFKKEEILWSAFRVFDSDGTGKITKSDLQKLLEGGQAGFSMEASQLDRIMQESDADGNGEINFQEFVDMMMKDD